MWGVLWRRLRYGYEGNQTLSSFTPSLAAQLVVGLALLILVILRVAGVYPSARALGIGAIVFLGLAIAAAVLAHRRAGM